MNVENLQGSIDLLQLNLAHVRDIPGREKTLRCVVIPIAENGMYVKTDSTGKKPEQVKMNINICANKDGANQWGNTHYAKFGYGKEFEEMYGEPLTTELRGRYCGNFKPLVFNNSGSAEGLSVPSMDDTTSPDLPF